MLFLLFSLIMLTVFVISIIRYFVEKNQQQHIDENTVIQPIKIIENNIIAKQWIINYIKRKNSRVDLTQLKREYVKATQHYFDHVLLDMIDQGDLIHYLDTNDIKEYVELGECV